MKRKIKIAFFIPTLNPGGTEHSFIKLANAMTDRIDCVQMVLCRREGALLSLLDNSVRVVDLGDKRFSLSFLPLVKYINKEEPDYLITGSNMHNEFVVLANMLSTNKTKVILTQRNYLNSELKSIPLYGSLYRQLMTFFYPKAYKVVAVSDGVLDMLKELHLAENATRIYNPFDIAHIQYQSQAEIIKAPSNFIIFVGRLVKVKNLTLLIDAFELLRKEDKTLSLCLVGDGVERSNLENYVVDRDLKDCVFFLGDKANVYPYIKRAKALVLPSLSESFGGVLVEALALGVPCVSTPTQGALEISNNGQFISLTSSFDDAEELKEKVMDVFKTPPCSTALMKRASMYSLKKSVSNYMDILVC